MTATAINHETTRIDYEESCVFKDRWYVLRRFPNCQFTELGFIQYWQRQTGQDKGHWHATALTFDNVQRPVEFAHCEPPSEAETERLWHIAETRQNDNGEIT